MFLLRRILVLLSPVLIFAFIELAFTDIYSLFWFLFVALLVLIFSLIYLIKEKVFSKDFFFLSVLPVLAYIFVIGFLLLPSEDIMRHLLIGIFVIFLMFYLENIFLFYWHSAAYQPHSLENLSAVFNLIIFFLLAINLNALSIFLDLPLWQLSLILIVGLVLSLAQSFWINKIKTRLKYIYLLVINVVILEFFWALTFLPNNYFVNSIILTVIFYFIWGIFKNKLNNKFDKNLFLRYLVISSILLIIVISTSNWT